MQLGEISFCDQIGYNVKSNELKEKILNELEVLVGFKVVQKHYERFSDHLISRLNSSPHLISLRSNGNPYLLYLTNINFQPHCIFIDKKIQHGYFFPRMIFAKLWFKAPLFENTLFDGEMIRKESGEWEYVINDILCYKNFSLEKYNLVKRINIVYNILSKSFQPDSIQVCQLSIKKYVTVDKIRYLVEEFMPSLNYTCRGIYFKPFFIKFKDVLLNFDDSLIKKVVRIKYKHTGETFMMPEDMNQQKAAPVPTQEEARTTISTSSTNSNNATKEFWVRKTSNPDIYELFEENRAFDSKPMIALVNNIDTSKFLRDSFRLLNVNDKLKMSCKFHVKFQKWIPMATNKPVPDVASEH